ncbi:hypothetical protein VP01_294g5 [Puccinia sorghi]|uniref:Uncharacterized protein n=1 Tax=Puccinia sorghi TaxID=27349 RepID=A0A0L6V0Y0_9BASI|nr:hypothetical protein VP01_294g5 [Puccinia sorghi]
MSGMGPNTQLGGDDEPARVTVNPYRRLMEQIDRVTFPEYTDSVRKVLIAFGCIHAITVLVCIVVLLIPLRRGPETREKFTWLLRKKYVTYASTPYHVMNGGLVSFKSLPPPSTSAASSLSHTLLSTIIVSTRPPSFLGLVFTSGWFFLEFLQQHELRVLCSPKYSKKRRRIFSHPLFLNTLFYGLPAITTLQTMGWSVALALAIRDQAISYNEIATHLKYGASKWQPEQSPNNPIHRRAVYLLEVFLIEGKKFSNCWIWSSRTWLAIGTALAIFYAFTVANLLQLLRTCLKASQGTGQFGGNKRRIDTLEQHLPSYTRENLESPTPRIPLSEMQVDRTKNLPRYLQTQRSNQDLKNGYIYLIVYCSIMLLDLLIHVTCTLIRTMHFQKAIVDKRWRSRTTWLVLLGSTLASVAMLFHSVRIFPYWRLLTERDKTHIPEPNPGILARKFLTSHREGGPKPEEANGGPKAQDCRSDDPRQIHKLAHKELSHSTKPISNWSINPLQPIRSPIDGVNRFPSYEMPPVSERGKTPGCYFFPEPALLTTHSNQILQ